MIAWKSVAIAPSWRKKISEILKGYRVESDAKIHIDNDKLITEE